MLLVWSYNMIGFDREVKGSLEVLAYHLACRTQHQRMPADRLVGGNVNGHRSWAALIAPLLG